MGFYLGCKQDICFFDPRGTWRSNKDESSPASEAGYYNDIMAVYERVQSGYKPEQIWVTSACGGSFPSAYLKAQIHRRGSNFIYENGLTDWRRDFFDQETWIVRKFTNYFWTGIASKDIPEKDKPVETGFNVDQLWKDLHQTDLGKVLVINVSNDQRLPSAVTERFITLAKRVNTYVRHISFVSTQKDPHVDRYFNYPQARSQALAIIFSKG